MVAKNPRITKRGVVSCKTERMGPFPNAHDRVSHITLKAGCQQQQLGELHTTARLEMPLEFLPAVKQLALAPPFFWTVSTAYRASQLRSLRRAPADLITGRITSSARTIATRSALRRAFTHACTTHARARTTDDERRDVRSAGVADMHNHRANSVIDHWVGPCRGGKPPYRDAHTATGPSEIIDGNVGAWRSAVRRGAGARRREFFDRRPGHTQPLQRAR